jgi:hypothetical protein
MGCTRSAFDRLGAVLCNRTISAIIDGEDAAMRIGIVSDTHDNLRALKRALAILRDEGIDTLLHCGDLCGPAVIEALAGFDTWIARGNMDHHPELEATAREVIGAGRFADCHRLTLAGHAAALVHGHRDGELRRLIHAGGHSYVFRGHTHRRRDRRIGQTRVINPGALVGMRWQQRSFCILDLAADEVAFIEL